MSEPTCGALLVGVSRYEQLSDLPFCERDAKVTRSALVRNLGIPCDSTRALIGEVSLQMFLDAVQEFYESEFDRKILYFSGHGERQNGLFLRLSDRGTQAIKTIDQLKSSCDSLVVLLDCCYSGRTCEEYENDMRTASQSNCGAGVLIVSSSTPREASYPSRDDDVSMFTRCFCLALDSQPTRNTKTISLVDTINTCRHFMDRYNEHAPHSRKQTMLVKDDLSGPIVFSNPSFKPIQQREPSRKIELGNTSFELEPIHSASYRRYRVSIVQEEEQLDAIVTSARKAIEYCKQQDMRQRLTRPFEYASKPLQRVVGYVYPTNDDLLHCNHSHMFDWQPINTNTVGIINDRNLLYSNHHLQVGKNLSYENLRKHINANRLTNSEAWLRVAGYLDGLDALWRSLSNDINPFIAGIISRQDLDARIAPRFEEINRFLNSALDTGYCNSKPLEDLINMAIGLSSTVNDLPPLFQPTKQGFRTDANLRDCLIDLKSRYARDYERTWTLLKQAEPLSELQL